LTREKEDPSLIITESSYAGRPRPHAAPGVKPSFTKQLSLREHVCLQKDVSGNAAPKSVRPGAVTKNLLGIPRKCPLRGTKPIGVTSNRPSDAGQEANIHCGTIESWAGSGGLVVRAAPPSGNGHTRSGELQ